MSKVMITPKMAANLIGKFANYADIDQRWVFYYICMLDHGHEEHIKANPIEVDEKGFIHNGRHRLLAAVIAQKSIHCEVNHVEGGKR